MREWLLPDDWTLKDYNLRPISRSNYHEIEAKFEIHDTSSNYTISDGRGKPIGVIFIY